MNKEIKKSINRIQKIVDFYKLNDEDNYDYSDDVLISMKTLLDYINNLQTRWNSLREWIKENSWYYNTSDGCQWVDQFKLLDKMNELEGDNNEDN